MSEPIHARINRLRTAHGLRLKHVAAALHCSTTAAHDYETGDVQLPLRHLEALADLFNVSTHYLLTGKEEPKYAALIQAIRQSGTRDARLLALIERV